MKFIDYGTMVIGSLLVGAAILSMVPTQQNIEIHVKHKDTIQDTVTSVKGKTALFIGDSHTAGFGWAYQVCTKTGMKFNNTAVSGKNTTWMLKVATESIHKNIDYCFIYGGANDMTSAAAITKAVDNIQKIVDICNQNNVHAVVILGYDANIVPMTTYRNMYGMFQDRLLSVTGAQVLDTRPAITDRTMLYPDGIHMKIQGHNAMSRKVIQLAKLKQL